MRPIMSSVISACITSLLITGYPLAGTWWDNFNDGDLKGWEKIFDSCGKGIWWVKNGALEVTLILDPRILRAESILGLTAFPVEEERFRVSLDVLEIRDGGRISIGILLGKRFDWAPSVYSTSYKFGARSIFGPTVLPDRSPNFDLWRLHIQRIEVEFDGGHFRCTQSFLEGEKKITEFEDGNFPIIDVIGLIAEGNELFHAVVDNFEISGPGIPDKQSFGVSPKDKLALLWGELRKR